MIYPFQSGLAILKWSVINAFCVQSSVMASAALTRDRILYYFPCQVKFHFLSFHVIDINRLFQRN